ncbi:MAG: PAS domain-containing protein [Muribaculaceae bacterium]|nr:PAS domain-containing protein [Muribaculaceae bacterium]
MRSKILVILTPLLMTALTAITFLALSAPLKWWGLGLGIGSLLLYALLYLSTVKPLTVARRGLDLIRAQDFNNRLVKVGEPGADKIVKLFNDLMEKLSNERLRLREQDNFLRLVIDASPVGIIMLNLEEKITMANRALFKIAEIPESDDLDGQHLSDVNLPIVNSLAKLKPGENAIIRLDGSRLYRGYHLWFLQEGFKRHFYMIESLTEEVRMAEKDAYEKVIRMISHEVNNTMGSVQSVLEILSEEMADDEQMSETIDSCIDRCRQMCGFIGAFAEIARIPEPVLTPVNIDEELQKMLPFFKLMVPEDVELIFNVDTNAHLAEKERKIIRADISLLQQVMVNIVKNATESFNDQKVAEVSNLCKIISIETAKDSNGVTLTISNNGTPISEEAARHIFTPFFSTKRSGRGLGLTLVSDVLRRHACTFSLRTLPDSLTRFRIHFPNP